jgi:hypothetical protein
MRGIFRNGDGSWKVRILDEDPSAIKVRMLEDTPFAESGKVQWVAPRFVKKKVKQ